MPVNSKEALDVLKEYHKSLKAHRGDSHLTRNGLRVSKINIGSDNVTAVQTFVGYGVKAYDDNHNELYNYIIGEGFTEEQRKHRIVTLRIVLPFILGEAGLSVPRKDLASDVNLLIDTIKATGVVSHKNVLKFLEDISEHSALCVVCVRNDVTGAEQCFDQRNAYATATEGNDVKIPEEKLRVLKNIATRLTEPGGSSLLIKDIIPASVETVRAIRDEPIRVLDVVPPVVTIRPDVKVAGPDMGIAYEKERTRLIESREAFKVQFETAEKTLKNVRDELEKKKNELIEKGLTLNERNEHIGRLKDEIKATQQAAVEAYDKQLTEIKNLTEKARALTAANERLNMELEDCRKNLPEEAKLKAVQDRFAEERKDFDARIKQLEDEHQQKEKQIIDFISNKCSEEKAEAADKFKQKIKELETQIQNFISEVGLLGDLENQVKQLQDENDQLKTNNQESEESIIKLKGDLKKLQDKLNSTQSELEDCKERERVTIEEKQRQLREDEAKGEEEMKRLEQEAEAKKKVLEEEKRRLEEEEIRQREEIARLERQKRMEEDEAKRKQIEEEQRKVLEKRRETEAQATKAAEEKRKLEEIERLRREEEERNKNELAAKEAELKRQQEELKKQEEQKKSSNEPANPSGSQPEILYAKADSDKSSYTKLMNLLNDIKFDIAYDYIMATKPFNLGVLPSAHGSSYKSPGARAHAALDYQIAIILRNSGTKGRHGWIDKLLAFQDKSDARRGFSADLWARIAKVVTRIVADFTSIIAEIIANDKSSKKDPSCITRLMPIGSPSYYYRSMTALFSYVLPYLVHTSGLPNGISIGDLEKGISYATPEEIGVFTGIPDLREYAVNSCQNGWREDKKLNTLKGSIQLDKDSRSFSDATTNASSKFALRYETTQDPIAQEIEIEIDRLEESVNTHNLDGAIESATRIKGAMEDLKDVNESAYNDYAYEVTKIADFVQLSHLDGKEAVVHILLNV